MKIFASGDFHGDSLLAKKLARTAKDKGADLVILCGDITHADKNHENIIGSFLDNKLKVAFVPGNHDSFATADFLSSFYGVTNLHGKGRLYGDIGVFGVGGANIGLEALSEDEIYERLKQGFYQIKDAKKKIMVSHVHPAGSKMEHFTSFFPGSAGIRRAIDSFKPDIMFCCHVHEAAGIEEKIGSTLVVNVCRQATIKDL